MPCGSVVQTLPAFSAGSDSSGHVTHVTHPQHRLTWALMCCMQRYGTLSKNLDCRQNTCQSPCALAGFAHVFFGRSAPMHMCVCVWGRHRRDPAVWRPLCNAWDSALHMLSRARGVTPLSFSALMEGHVAHQLLKPVRARWEQCARFCDHLT